MRAEAVLLPCGLPTSEPLEVVVRIYLIRGINLHPEDPNGKSDPYLIARRGDSHEFNDRQHYMPMQLNPSSASAISSLHGYIYTGQSSVNSNFLNILEKI